MAARIALFTIFLAFSNFGFSQPTIETFGITTPPNPADLVECQAGFWKAGPDITDFEAAIPSAHFIPTFQDRIQRGFSLEDFEVRVDPSGNVAYDVFWRSGSGRGTQTLALGLAWSEMGDVIAREELKGRLLVDLEIVEVPGSRLYSALFKTRKGPQMVTDGYGLTLSSFIAHNSSMLSQGFRMADFETFVEAGTRFFLAVWHEGSGPSYYSIGEDWLDFHQTFHDKNPENLRLVDFESYVENGVARYIGFWGPGQEEDHFIMVPGPVDMEKATPNTVKNTMTLIDYEILQEDPGKHTIHGKRAHHAHSGHISGHDHSHLPQARDKGLGFVFNGNNSIITSMIHNGGSVGPGN